MSTYRLNRSESKTLHLCDPETGESLPEITVYRIIDSETGEKCGWAESYNNLKARDSNCCGIFDEAIVAGNAVISDNAQILGNTLIYGNVRVSNNADISDNAILIATKGQIIVDGGAVVHENAKIIGVREDGRFVEAWKKENDGSKDGTRHMEVLTKGQVIDRVGADDGDYFSPMDKNGKPYSLKERAIGDYLPEKTIEDNASYHKYEIQEDFTRKNFETKINDSYSNGEISRAERDNYLDKLENYYSQSNAGTSYGCNNEKYVKPGQAADGVRTAEIAPMFVEGTEPDGGGVQYITPFTAAELEKIQMINEID